MLDLMFSPRASASDERLWSSMGGGRWYPRTRAGVQVDEHVAMLHSAVSRCTRLLSEPPAGLPLMCYERKGLDRVPANPEDVSAMELVQFAPNPDMTAGVWRERTIQHQVNWGGGFSEIVRDPRGRVVALWPIHASRVSPTSPEDREQGYAYAVQNDDGTRTGLRASEMLHVCGMLSNDGVWGMGVIAAARENVGGALAVERHGASYFGSGGQPKGVLIVPGNLTEPQVEMTRRQWREVHSSPGSNEVAVVPAAPGAGYTPISISNSDNQFVELQGVDQSRICVWYGVPQHLLGAKAPAGSIETLSAEFIIYGMFPWVGKVEQQMNFKLLRPNQRSTHYFEHDFTRLLRGDIAARYNAYRVGLCTGFLTVNQICRFENLPGIGPAGDVHYIPANLVRAEDMASGAASGRPPGSDHNGAPADHPLDHMPQAVAEWVQQSLSVHDRADPGRVFATLLRGLPKIQADTVKQQLAAVESRMEDRPIAWREAARGVLSDTLRRMFTKESQAALAVIDSKPKYEAWKGEFYAKHETTLTAALGSACPVLELAGVKQWAKPADLAAFLRTKSVEALDRIVNNGGKEARFRELAAWPTDRVERMAEEILG